MNCDVLESVYYRNLCKVLSIGRVNQIPNQPNPNQINPTRPTPSPFTGNKATDTIILTMLNDLDLINVCHSNKYLNNLCNNEAFWINRTVQNYGDALGNASQIAAYVPRGTSWKQYYLWLSDMMLRDATTIRKIAETHNRDDLKLLLQKMYVLPGWNTGVLNRPYFMSENLYRFLQQADLGLSDPSDPTSIPMNQALESIKTGITTRGFMAGIIVLYALVNKMHHSENSRLLRSTPLMNYYFHNTYNHLRDRNPDFNSDNLSYLNLQNIVLNNLSERIYPSRPGSLIQIPSVEELDQLRPIFEREKMLVTNAIRWYRQ